MSLNMPTRRCTATLEKRNARGFLGEQDVQGYVDKIE
jgi:hypothetical protein